MSNPGWVAGVMDWNPNNPDNTNSAQLLDREKTPLADYLKSADVYKCPADNFTSRKFKASRVRSYSLNAVLTGTNGPIGFSTNLANPGPASIFTFVCEHPDSINDGTFQIEPKSGHWADLPSSHHKGPSCPIGFADGHSEIHKWAETRGANKTVYPVTMTTNRPWADKPVGTSRDYEWMQARMP